MNLTKSRKDFVRFMYYSYPLKAQCLNWQHTCTAKRLCEEDCATERSTEEAKYVCRDLLGNEKCCSVEETRSIAAVLDSAAFPTAVYVARAICCTHRACAQPRDRDLRLKRSADHDMMDVGLPRLPDVMHAADHLLLDCDVRLRLTDDHVRGGGEREARRVALRREEEGLHGLVADEAAYLGGAAGARGAEAGRAHAVHGTRRGEETKEHLVPREDDGLGGCRPPTLRVRGLAECEQQPDDGLEP